METDTKRFYEDFEIGEVRHMGDHAVSREEILRFAREWDPQPFHVDEEAARASVFGGLTASSCHTFAIVARIAHRGPDDMAVVANLGTALQFPAPVRPGDRLELLSECIGKRLSASRPGVGIVTTRSRLVDAEGVTKAVMESSFMVWRRDAEASGA